MQPSIKVAFTVALFVATSQGVAHAQSENKYNSIYSACVQRAGGMANNMVVYMCSDETSDKAKADINTYFNIMHKKLAQSDIEAARKLTLTQKAWLQYRNNHCQLMGQYVDSPMYSYCPMQLNIKRALELKEMSE